MARFPNLLWAERPGFHRHLTPRRVLEPSLPLPSLFLSPLSSAHRTLFYFTCLVFFALLNRCILPCGVSSCCSCKGSTLHFSTCLFSICDSEFPIATRKMQGKKETSNARVSLLCRHTLPPTSPLNKPPACWRGSDESLGFPLSLHNIRRMAHSGGGAGLCGCWGGVCLVLLVARHVHTCLFFGVPRVSVPFVPY